MGHTVFADVQFLKTNFSETIPYFGLNFFFIARLENGKHMLMTPKMKTKPKIRLYVNTLYVQQSLFVK